MSQQQKTALITGVSTGIGHGIVRVLIDAGWRVFGSVRQAADADRLQAEFGALFEPLIFDVNDEAAVMAAADAVRTKLGGCTLDALINNAGLMVVGPLLLMSVEDFKYQIDTNLVGIHTVTRSFAPLLGIDASLQGDKGRIINISSVAGKLAPPIMGAYAATKHGLEGYTDALRRELAMYDIKVITVNPGSIKSPVVAKTDAVEQQYKNTDYAAAVTAYLKIMHDDQDRGFAPEHLGNTVLQALVARKPKLRYAIVPGRFQNWTLANLLPAGLMDKAMSDRFKTDKLP